MGFQVLCTKTVFGHPSLSFLFNLTEDPGVAQEQQDWKDCQTPK